MMASTHIHHPQDKPEDFNFFWLRPKTHRESYPRVAAGPYFLVPGLDKFIGTFALDQTPNLLLPYIMAAQAQKHVTHNEAIKRLDAIVHLAVVDRDLTAPPGSPVEGARYIVGPSPTGAWAGQTNAIAAYQDGAWAFYTPLEGWLAWIADEDVLTSWSGTAWSPVSSATSVNPTPLVGVNATADATNKLSVSSSAVLFNHIGNGTQVKLNKAASTDTASFLFQDGFSGRAEIGLTGNDDFHFKVSPDGTTWKDALIIDKTSGAVSMPFTSGGGVTDGDKGDVTVTASGATWTVDANAISNAKLADVPTATLKGRITAATGDPEDLTSAQARTLLGLATIATSGSAADLSAGTLPAARFDDTAHGARAGGTLHADATTSVSGFMSGADKSKLNGIAVGANNYVHPNHSGDVTSTGDGATVIAAGAVTNAKLASVPASSIKGNSSGSAATPTDLTGTQATALLDLFAASGASSKKGLVPDPGSTAGATRFLREDAIWATPPGGAGGTGADGSAVIDFGVGTDTAALAITGQASIAASSVTRAWIFPKDSADHSADEHFVEEIDVCAGVPTAGTGFTIFARTRNKPLRGQWTVAWSWR